MAQSRVLIVLACLALASFAAAAPACIPDAEIQTATLKSSNPKGCLTNDLTQREALGISASCFDAVKLYRQGGGASCTGFGVALAGVAPANADTPCLTDPVGNGTLAPKKGGGYSADGSFITQQNFTGTQSADNTTFTVAVDGFDCELTYTLKASPAARTARTNGTMADNNATPAAPDAPAPPAAPATAAPAPTGNSAAGALPSAVLLFLGAALVLAL